MNNNDFKELTVWQVNEYIRMLLDSDVFLGEICVRGEISNFKHYTQSGHMYFSLKDEQAILKSVMFKSYAA
jgi:exodeoxyribonuclease VII large subunit